MNTRRGVLMWLFGTAMSGLFLGAGPALARKETLEEKQTRTEARHSAHREKKEESRANRELRRND